MRSLNKRIAYLEIPDRMKRLPISDEGYPVPYFVPWIDGKPEFRGMDSEKFGLCVRHHRCWLCGFTLGKFKTFPIGPMCAVNRVISEPPSHHGCALYGMQACPFLTEPRMRRNEANMPEGHIAGVAIKRNPGVTCLWTTLSYKLFRPPNGGVLFELGEPEKVEWFCQGRQATREEILASMSSGLPILTKMAAEQGSAAIAELSKQYDRALQLVPA
jgi:hypothetical protein